MQKRWSHTLLTCVQGRDKKQWAQAERQKMLSELFLSEGDQPLAQAAQRGCRVSFGDIQKTWLRSNTSKFPAWVGLDDLQRSLPLSAILCHLLATLWYGDNRYIYTVISQLGCAGACSSGVFSRNHGLGRKGPEWSCLTSCTFLPVHLYPGFKLKCQAEMWGDQRGGTWDWTTGTKQEKVAGQQPLPQPSPGIYIVCCMKKYFPFYMHTSHLHFFISVQVAGHRGPSICLHFSWKEDSESS